MLFRSPTRPTPAVPVAYKSADVAAIQAISRGEASAEQQIRFLKWLIEQCAGTYDFHFFEGERETSFALGKAFVGQQCVKLLKLNVSSLVKAEESANAEK